MIKFSAEKKTFWDIEAYHARIADCQKKIRHEAGSPNAEEIECYGFYLRAGFNRVEGQNSRKNIAVLGMTPELRRLAHGLNCDVTCIDIFPEAISLFRDWISEEHQDSEKIIQGKWSELANLLDVQVDAIVGDGVFGNILSIPESRHHLQVFKKSLIDKGFLVLRKIIIPKEFPLNEHRADVLLQRFRAGDITEAEFGFGMRIFGSHAEAYDRDSYILDNGVVFRKYLRWYEKGLLSDREYAAIRSYYFKGQNLVLPQELWENMLREEGYSFQLTMLTGRMWYQYYPIYCCFDSQIT